MHAPAGSGSNCCKGVCCVSRHMHLAKLKAQTCWPQCLPDSMCTYRRGQAAYESAFPLLPAAPRAPRHQRHQRPMQGGHRQGAGPPASGGGSALHPQDSSNITSSGRSHVHNADVSERASQGSRGSVPRQSYWGHPDQPLQRVPGSMPAVRDSNYQLDSCGVA